MTSPIYLDCNATTPAEPRVGNVVSRYLLQDFGNAGSRTHEYGALAKRAVNEARTQIASVVQADPSEIIFTSGATESNNLAILGLAEALLKSKRTHVLSTGIEHKAVLEPLEQLAERGLDVQIVAPDQNGYIHPALIAENLRANTGLVTVMHVNNETGVIQPIQEIAKMLDGAETYFHVDAAQGFGKVLGLESPRIDLISISGHKIYAPKGVGALVVRRRGLHRPPLSPLMVGGGQERGLRPGTLPVHLIAGLGEAARLAANELKKRTVRCLDLKAQVMECFTGIPHQINGLPNQTVASTLNISLTGIDAEAAILCLKDVAAISNGAACTSASYETSHVLQAMKLEEPRIRSSLRWSWCHMTPDIPIDKIRAALLPFA